MVIVTVDGTATSGSRVIFEGLELVLDRLAAYSLSCDGSFNVYPKWEQVCLAANFDLLEPHGPPAA